MAALINIRFLKYLSHPPCQRYPSRPPLPSLPRSTLEPTSPRVPGPLAKRSSKARYSICIFKLESLYSHAGACTFVHVHDDTAKRPATTIAIRHHHYHRRRRRRPPPSPSSHNPLLLLRLLLHLHRPLLRPEPQPLSLRHTVFQAVLSTSFPSFSSSSRASLLFFSVLCVLQARFRQRVCIRARRADARLCT